MSFKKKQSSYRVEKYSSKYFDQWNNFLKNAKNATFLFHRDFMEYHSDRFDDFSLLVFKENALVAIFPANKKEDKVYSHQGLTYGGIFTKDKISGKELRQVLDRLFFFLTQSGIRCVCVKRMPSIYTPFFDGIWDCLSKNYNVKILSKQKLLSVDYSNYKLHKTKLKHYKKGVKNGLVIKEEGTFTAFWNKILIPRLATRYNSKPVHTLEEIEYLYKLFPKNLLQYNVYLDHTILAGITIIDKGDVVKSQYGASTDLGDKNYAMDFLFVHLIKRYESIGKKFFSMGTVTANNELGYNPGMLRQKIELGCSEYPFEYFQITLDD